MWPLEIITLTVFLSLIWAVTTVIDRVAQLVAVDAAVVVTAETERCLTLDFHCGWAERAGLKKTSRQVQQMKIKAEQFSFFVRWTSYSRGEAPHLSYLHSRCLRHTSKEAGRIRGSYTQTGRWGSMCHWENGWLEVKIRKLKKKRKKKGTSMHRDSQSSPDTYGKMSHLYSPDSQGFHHIWSVQRYSDHCHTGSNPDGTSVTLRRQANTRLKNPFWTDDHFFCLWCAPKHEVWLLLCLCSPLLLTNRQPTKSLHLPQSLSSELSSQSLSWSQTQRSGMQRRLSQRNSLSVHARGAEARHENRD